MKEYDGNGNITKVTDFKSNATSYNYDVHNQRTGIGGKAATEGRPTHRREHAARIQWGGRPHPTPPIYKGRV